MFINIIMSKIQNYFNSINKNLDDAYEIANNARKKNLDNSEDVEIPITNSISQRVIGLISILEERVKDCGIEKRILELEKKFGVLDWRVALTISYEISSNKFIKFNNMEEALNIGIRVGFAYITLGVISAPIEGISQINLKKRYDNEDYLSIYFSGPIRAAGGTAAAVCVLICDYVRKKLNIKSYDIQEIEKKRYYTEILEYNDRCVKLQYLPSEEECNFLVENLGIEITGDPTEKLEVPNQKDLKRVLTNRIRGGMCLVIGECLIQKASKLNKRINEWGEDFGLDNWFFLDDFLKLQKKIKSQIKLKKKILNEVLPNYKFIEDMVAGRPVLTFPLQKGGFRLRYGRCRTSGFASTSISSQTFFILNDFLAVGTQLRIERPGKATVITPCSNLEPPIVKLKSGDVIKLETDEMAKKYSNEILEILHLGDILISFGEFSENNQNLVPAGYTEEEWKLDLGEKIK